MYMCMICVRERGCVRVFSNDSVIEAFHLRLRRPVNLLSSSEFMFYGTKESDIISWYLQTAFSFSSTLACERFFVFIETVRR